MACPVRRNYEVSAMAMKIAMDGSVCDQDRRARVFAGEIFCLPPATAVTAFCDFAWELIDQAFHGLDPSTAHEVLRVDEYVKTLGPLKTGFTHHPESKRLLRELLIDAGADPATTYFDVPKLRVVPPATYLTVGLGYNYTPHRDTWYSAPPCQVNWWAPISGVTDSSCMTFHPDFWQQPTSNTSAGFDAYEWNRSSRRDAGKYTTSDPRPHPRLDGTDPGSDVRIVGQRGTILCFSADHLHATVPNTTNLTRFSVDFRTVSIHDVRHHAGPTIIDSRSTGTTLHDFIGCDTREQLPVDLIAEYDVNGSVEGLRVFDPSILTRS
jgi:hypothetical protein